MTKIKRDKQGHFRDTQGRFVHSPKTRGNSSKRESSLKPIAKKSSTKKTVAKKLPLKKASSKKLLPGKSPLVRKIQRKLLPGKVRPKKIFPKKVLPKKVLPKKVPPQKVSPKKALAKKFHPKKALPKKVIPKKVPPKKVPPKKAPQKKVPLKKISPKKVLPKKVIPKKVPSKKVPPKKVPLKKVPLKKVPLKKVPPKKPAPQKPVAKKQPPKKPTPKKPATKKPISKKPIPRRQAPKRPKKRKPKKPRVSAKLPPISQRSAAAEREIQERIVALMESIKMLQRGLNMSMQTFVNLDGTVDGELRLSSLPREWKDEEGLPELIATLSNAFQTFPVFDRQPSMGGSFWFSVAVRFGPENEAEMGELAELYKRHKGLFQIGTYPTRADHATPLQLCLTDDRMGLRGMIGGLEAKRGLPPTSILMRFIWGPEWNPDVSGKRPTHYQGEKGDIRGKGDGD
jgi:hypothetical protein